MLKDWLTEPKVSKPSQMTEPSVEYHKLMYTQDDSDKEQRADVSVHTDCDMMYNYEHAQKVCVEHGCDVRRVITRRVVQTETGCDRIVSLLGWACS